jgi:hypothetical protein
MAVYQLPLPLFFGDEGDDALRQYLTGLYASGQRKKALSLYSASRLWAKLRQERFMIAQWHCERCDATNVPLQLHHLTYENRFYETLEDVCALCAQCHEWMSGKDAA